MTDEDVEMKRRFSGQARPPADTAWASDHLGGGDAWSLYLFIPTAVSSVDI